MSTRRCSLLPTLAVVVALLPVPLAAQAGDPSRLTLERIFASRDFRGERGGATRWLDDSTYTMIATPATGGADELVRIDAASGRRTVLVSATMLRPTPGAAPLELEDYSWSPDRTQLLVFTNSARVWRENTRGDFWVLSLRDSSLRKLGGSDATASTLQFATFSPDGRRVAYVREHNLYVESLADRRVVALTTDGSDKVINGTFDWVYEEELFMRNGFRWSPDGTQIAYWQLDATGVRDFLLINDTDSLYSFTIPIQYPKAGTTNSAARIGVVGANGGATRWMDVPGDARNNYLARMDWAANSTELVIQQLNRRQNVNTFFVATATSGATRPLFVERDSAWIDIYDDHVGYGPGPSLHWLPDASGFVYLSERDGWRHAWMVSRTGTMRLITTGAFDVMRVRQIDLKNGWLYFDASPENATQMFLWRTRLDGKGTPQQLTPAGARGTHDYDIGPGARYAIHAWSAVGIPPTMELVRLPAHQVVRPLVGNERLAATLARLRLGRTEFFRVDAGQGVSLDAWMITPPDFDSTRTYPVLFHVYGEPASQTVTDAYGGSTWLWHQLLAQEGVIVVSVDNRGTPGPRGRAWRKALHNQMGALRVREQSAAARAIARRPYVDSTRLGIWGWSGGGSSTLHLMFRAPGLFRMGMSVAPVADVRNYDTIYQERYVGLPSTDSAAYRDASAITFASGLRGDLLLVHGTGDDNVHYQGTEQLMNALIALNTPFDMMSYPNRTHGIYEGAGTTLHLYSLLTRYVREHLEAPGASARR